MGSRIAFNVIEILSSKIGGRIRKGRPLPVLVGSLLGMGIGCVSARYAGADNIGYYLGWGGVGALVGSVATASIFRLPPAVVDAQESLGRFYHHWLVAQKSSPGTVYKYYVLTEYAIVHLVLDCYLGDEPPEFESWLSELENGKIPDVSAHSVHSLEGLKSIEVMPHDCRFATVRCELNGRPSTFMVEVSDCSEMQFLIKALEVARGITLEESEREMDLGEATFWPGCWTIVAGTVVAAIAWLANYWIQSPPRPPRGKPDGDELVLMLTWAGPKGVALAGLVPVGLLAAWWVRRVYARPKFRVFAATPDA